LGLASSIGAVVAPATASASAFGALDHVSWAAGALTARGWAVGDGVESVSVHVYVDGAFAGATITKEARADVAAAFPGHGSTAGFAIELVRPAGAYHVCAYALTDDGSNPLLGCRGIDVPVHPFGTIDALSLAPGGVVVRGWAIDPDAPADAAEVHVYVDGVLTTGGTANDTRIDLAKALPYGREHGYSVAVPLGVGEHQLCAYGLNVSGSVGVNSLLACRTLSRAGDPVGFVSFAGMPLGGSFQAWSVYGYLVDPDTNEPVDVHIYRFGWPVSNASGPAAPPTLESVVRANALPHERVSPDAIRPLVRTFGTNHGFVGDVTWQSGIFYRCAYAVNAPGTPGGNFLLGCTGPGPSRDGTVGGPFE
jgi:hypothetical protein